MELPKMRKIPEKAYKYARDLFELKGQLQYQRTGRRISIYCTACGTRYEGVTRLGDSYEQQMAEHLIEAPEAGIVGKCELCGARAEYKQMGRLKRAYMNHIGWMIGQRMGQDFVFRVFNTTQTTDREYRTTYEHQEYARIYLQKGKKPEKRYLYCGWYGNGGWYSGGNCTGLSVFVSNVYPGTYDEIRKTPMLKYGDPEGWHLIDYYSAFARYPDMEMVQKLGMVHLMRALIAEYGANLNPKGKEIWDRLRIYKDRLPELKEKRGDLKYLRAFQTERRSKRHWTPQELEQELYLQDLWSDNERKTVRDILKYTTLGKLVRYRKKNEHLGVPFDIYLDYIRMRQRAGYDLNDDIILFPKDLRRRHDEMVLELEKVKQDERKREVLQKYPKIAERFEKLNKKYGATLGEYSIRPAKDAAEIVEEGRILHHCVGGDNYLNGHAEGKGIILFMRRASEPEMPFCTIEIRGNKIEQWYEAYDKQPDADILQPLLDDYVKRLEGQKRGRTRNTVSAELQ